MGMWAVGSYRTQLPTICGTLVMAELRVRIVLAVSCAPKCVSYPWCAAAWSALLRQPEHPISKFEWRWSTIVNRILRCIVAPGVTTIPSQSSQNDAGVDVLHEHIVMREIFVRTEEAAANQLLLQAAAASTAPIAALKTFHRTCTSSSSLGACKARTIHRLAGLRHSTS